ncbi:hypothetical protein B0H67DRAFT_582568 [Lasiosphaeris hirsuta]|uniref:Uncharacterized protein n=1 Tax=Lasiosphaeris hirsuta TaxID=260670 RepID=A0AA40DTY2_9PEZI|nr:hypothetical protein B0H67DRAFT_582568 [Lasiosphaeris hirsuta]
MGIHHHHWILLLSLLGQSHDDGIVTKEEHALLGGDLTIRGFVLAISYSVFKNPYLVNRDSLSRLQFILISLGFGLDCWSCNVSTSSPKRINKVWVGY